MANVVDYLKWRGDLEFRKSPFNEVDNLILTQLVYLDFQGIVPDISESGDISLNDAARLYFAKSNQRKKEEIPLLIRDCEKILKEMMHTVRFGDCRLSHFVKEVSEVEEFQFSAMKIVTDDKSIYLSFSGTDSSLAGWKENFNMSYLEETPSQRKAVEYAGKVLGMGVRKVRFGGHSKGGNLAVYAAIKSRRAIQNRLIEVYNFDGPGFTAEMVSREEYQYVLPKIHTIIPQSSVIGMLLEHEEEYQIVESEEKGLLQHRAYSWQVMGTRLVRMDSLTQDSIFWDGTLKKWIARLNNEERKSFVNALFAVFEKANINDAEQLKKITWKKFITLLRAVDKLSEEERSILSVTIKKLVDEEEKEKERTRKHRRSNLTFHA